MKIVQCLLVDHNYQRIAWIEKDSRLKKGVRVSLKEDKNLFYIVKEIYRERDSKSLHTDWEIDV